MFFTQLVRKPLLPLLLAVLCLLGTVFPAFLAGTIHQSLAEVDDLYRGMTIQCQLLPQATLGVQFSLGTGTAGRILDCEAVQDHYGEMYCPYYFRDPGPSSTNSLAYGTNDPERFASQYGLTLTFGEGFSPEQFAGGDNICLVSEQLLTSAGRSVGDQVTVAGSGTLEQKDEAAPDLVLTIAGTFSIGETQDGGSGGLRDSASNDYELQWTNILVPLACFTDPFELISTSQGVQNWRSYRAFTFTIDPAYNREFDTVKTELQQIIGRDWLLYATSRELNNAVQPMEQRLQVQQILYAVVSVLLILLPAFVMVLLCRGWKREILVRLLFGEKSGRVFASIWLPAAALVLALSAAGAGLAWLVWRQLLWQTAAMAALAVAAAGATVGVFCRTNLVTLYQGEEE